MSRRWMLVAVSLLVGAMLGAAAVTLARAQLLGGSLDPDIVCEPLDPGRSIFLSPTGVRVQLVVRFTSGVDIARAPDGEVAIEATFSMPPRWTAYAQGSTGGGTAEVAGRVEKTFSLPSDVLEPGYGLVESVREGRRRLFLDVLGPTDAPPDSFSVRVVMRDLDGARIERVLEDACPLPAGPQYQPEERVEATTKPPVVPGASSSRPQSSVAVSDEPT